MKRFIILAITLFAAGALTTGCDADRVSYSEAERIMFADTLQTCPVVPDNDAGFAVKVASTVRCDYDRTFGVEVVDAGSTAIENYHYRLAANSVTIKAGEGAAEVRLLADYDHFEASDSLGVVLRLVTPDAVKWDMYPQQTKVVFMKCCPFDIHDWTSDGGNFILYATFPFSDSSIEKRLVKAEAMPDGRRIRFKSMLGEGFDLKMRFSTGDPLDPTVEVLPKKAFFASNYGDIYSQTDPAASSYYYACQKQIVFYLLSYSDNVGSFGSYAYILEWITQKQADYYASHGFPASGLGF